MALKFITCAGGYFNINISIVLSPYPLPSDRPQLWGDIAMETASRESSCPPCDWARGWWGQCVKQSSRGRSGGEGSGDRDWPALPTAGQIVGLINHTDRYRAPLLQLSKQIPPALQADTARSAWHYYGSPSTDRIGMMGGGGASGQLV